MDESKDGDSEPNEVAASGDRFDGRGAELAESPEFVGGAGEGQGGVEGEAGG